MPEKTHFATTGFVAYLADVSRQCVTNYITRGIIAPCATAHTFGDKPISLFSSARLMEVVETVRKEANGEAQAIR